MTTKTKRNQKLTVPGVLLVFAILVIVVPQVGATPQIMTEYGDQMAWRDAEINAMGGTGTALYRGGMSNIFNPAFLVNEDNYRLDLGFSLDQEHEDRFVPLFDGFDSYLTDVAIASNRNHYWQTGAGFAGRLLKGDLPLSVGVSLTDRYPFSYTFEEEVRNPSGATGDNRDRILEERQRKVTGTLRNLSLGAGLGLFDRLSFGAAVHYAFGTRTEVNSVRDYEDSSKSYHEQDEFTMDGVNFTVGLRGVITERVELGVSWESQLSATGNFTTTRLDADDNHIDPFDAEYRYPNVYRVGLTFRPRTDPRTIFTIEGEYKPWSEMNDSLNPKTGEGDDLQDVGDVRIGVEHTFYNGIPLRFGFRYFDSYADKEANASVFSAGVGMPLGNGMLSASMELSKITSVQDHQFPYPDNYQGDQFESDPQARVEDTRFRIGVGYKLEF
ncbi:MAG: hypothetical protein KAH56_04685 [Candidatus Krumholzibacteria bacterium]|nr:hypothetical protein [Candidatus Krumholzibacteria bacterium]